MKKALLTLLSIGLALTLINAQGKGSGNGNGYGNGNGGNGNRGGNNKSYDSNNTQTTTLTQQQKDDLLYMYEEEKLARDVYITLGEKWDSKVFLNIQKSEQTHMDSVKSLLIKYSLPIPEVKSGVVIPVDEDLNIYIPYSKNNIGVFKNQKLQALYYELIKKGTLSLKDALEVGVLVEETDIADLEEKIEGVPEDIENVYNKLLKGSYNHLDAFNKNLEKLSK